MTERIHYDRDVDVLYIQLYCDPKPVAPMGVVTQQHEWGLLEFDGTGVLVGIEVWSISKIPGPKPRDPDMESPQPESQS